jgi:putative intracellular protease/amidase
MHNPTLIDWIKARSQRAELLLSVCTGALLLAKAGLLDGLEAATHHGAIDLLRQVAPKTTVHAARRFEDLPVLADLLEEVGCCDAELLVHLRGPGPMRSAVTHWTLC